MHYFAYGSNMSRARLQARVPSADALGCFVLHGYDLRFHKSDQDGSGKCDAFFTGDPGHVIYGVLFEIDPAEKYVLDKAEELGIGYDQTEVTVSKPEGASVIATTYVARKIDENLKPFSWYLNHVLIGAKEARLPEGYIEEKIASIEAVEDRDKNRDARQRAIHK